MRKYCLEQDSDFSAWQPSARSALRDKVPPDEVEWVTRAHEQEELFNATESEVPPVVY